MYHEFNSESADETFDELPRAGDEMEYNGKTHLILRVEVVNDSALHLKTQPKKEIRYIEDMHHNSKDWDELPDRFLEGGQEQKFLDENSLRQP